MDVTIIWSTMPKIHEDKSKSKVNLPVGVKQSPHTGKLIGYPGVDVFVYISSLKMVGARIAQSV
jgi:hypothetical protein